MEQIYIGMSPWRKVEHTKQTIRINLKFTACLKCDVAVEAKAIYQIMKYHGV